MSIHVIVIVLATLISLLVVLQLKRLAGNVEFNVNSNKTVVAVVVNAFVTSKLDCCNALLYGLPKHQLQRLKYVQGTAAKVE